MRLVPPLYLPKKEIRTCLDSDSCFLFHFCFGVIVFHGGPDGGVRVVTVLCVDAGRLGTYITYHVVGTLHNLFKLLMIPRYYRCSRDLLNGSFLCTAFEMRQSM